MNLGQVKLLIILICLTLTLCGCADLKNKAMEQVVPTDFIIPINIGEVLKIPETDVINYFQNYREDFKILGKYLLENDFKRGLIDKTFFINTQGNDILIVQIYINDVLIGATSESLGKEFFDFMSIEIEMNTMGELTLFLRLQIK